MAGERLRSGTSSADTITSASTTATARSATGSGRIGTAVGAKRASVGLSEDVVDNGCLLVFAGAEVASGGLDGSEAEQGLDLGGVSSALAQAGGIGVAAAMGSQARDAGVIADGENDLDDAGDGERAALPGPQRPRVTAAFVQPGGEAVAGDLREGEWCGPGCPCRAGGSCRCGR